ncbi:MAG: DUF452 family protein [Bacteroides sp.]|nr:DUF452 family protein [Bacteroides sp.]
MKVDFLSKTEGRSRLLLVFNGWSVPVPSAAESFSVPGYDIAVVSDYRQFVLPEISGYKEVVVLAWSLGVHAAEIALQNTRLPLTLTIAVNGTPCPVSDTEGIPREVFRLTAERLTEQSLMKFRRRMGAADMERGPRPIEELRSELLDFPSEPVPFRWDYAVISSDDKIFPPENQRLAWLGRAEIIELQGAHLPDFHSILERLLINKECVITRFTRGRATYQAEASVQNRVLDHLLELWLKHRSKQPGGRVLEIGAGAGEFAELYSPKIKPAELILWDIAPYSDAVVAADGEADLRLVDSASLRAIVAASTVQWFNSVAAFLLQVARVLEPGGLAVLSSFGPQTFKELSQCGVVPLPYLAEDSLRRIIPANMEILELHSGKIIKVFDTPMDALRHCRDTGVNARPSAVSVREIERLWPRRDDGRVSLTFEPIYLILRKK